VLQPTTSIAPPNLTTNLRRFVYLLVIGAAAGSSLANILSVTMLYNPARRWPAARPPSTPILSANDQSRWCTVWSLVERGTYQIDDILQQPGWDTVDKGRFREHFYSSKPPFLSTIVAGLYWVLKHAFGFDLLARPHETVRVTLLVINWLPWIVSLALLAAIGERYAHSDWGRIYLIIAAAGGTFLTTFLSTFNNHTIAATAVVFSLYPFLLVVNDGRRSPFLFALAGFWAAFAACSELPAAAYGLVLFVMLVRRAPATVLTWFMPAALAPVILFLFTNWLCTGGLMPFYANFGSPNDTFYKYVYNGVPSYWMNPFPQDAGESSALVYLFHCIAGHHGIFSLSPIFLLTIAGWSLLGRASPLRSIGCLSLALTVWVLDFYLLQTHSYNYGGNTSGLRWAFWLIPLWVLALIPALDHWGDRSWFRILSAVLLLASVFSASYPHDNPWQQPWIMNAFGLSGGYE